MKQMTEFRYGARRCPLHYLHDIFQEVCIPSVLSCLVTRWLDGSGSTVKRLYLYSILSYWVVLITHNCCSGITDEAKRRRKSGRGGKAAGI